MQRILALYKSVMQSHLDTVCSTGHRVFNKDMDTKRGSYLENRRRPVRVITGLENLSFEKIGIVTLESK